MPLRARVGRHTRNGGRHCQNWPDDQQIVISLLSRIPVDAGGVAGSLSKPVISGICSAELYRAISTFEDKYWPGQRSGYVDPGGAMLKRMEELAAKSAAVSVATGTIRFVTPEQWLGLPTGKTRVISNKGVPLASNDVLWVGLEGDLQNIVKTVSADIPAAVAIVESSPTGGTRWFRLSQPHGSECHVQAKDNSGKIVTSFHLSLIQLPKGRGSIDFDIGPDGIPVHTPPRARADYVDTRMEGIGYNIYLQGCQIYCTGMSTPIYVSDSFLKLDIDKAEAIDSTVYDTIEERHAVLPSITAKVMRSCAGHRCLWFWLEQYESAPTVCVPASRISPTRRAGACVPSEGMLTLPFNVGQRPCRKDR